MPPPEVDRPDAPETRSDAFPSGPGVTPTRAELSPQRQAEIAERAYEIASRRGFREGEELENWLQAEREVEAGPVRNTAPDNPFDAVKNRSNE